jgi:hypothetical protein
MVSGVLSDPQMIAAQLQALLAGVTIEARTTPSGVANEAVRQVSVTGTDAHGIFSQLAPKARQATGTAAMMLLGQYYPNAAIALTVVDEAGASLVSGSKSPGEAPVVSS